jgi:hypothetical protein
VKTKTFLAGLISIAAFVSLSLPAVLAQEFNLFNKDWMMIGRIQDGKIFDLDMKIEGYIADNRIFDKNWMPTGYIKGDRIFDPNGNLLGYIRKGRFESSTEEGKK